jgi:DNA-binding MarR family transcriptional regulator
MLKGLSEHGWIERRRIKADQRAVQLFLTSAGTRIIDATGGRAVGMLQRAVSKLSDVEVDALSSGLAALIRELPPPSRP